MAWPLFILFVLNDGGRYDIDHVLGTHHKWIRLFVGLVDFTVSRYFGDRLLDRRTTGGDRFWRFHGKFLGRFHVIVIVFWRLKSQGTEKATPVTSLSRRGSRTRWLRLDRWLLLGDWSLRLCPLDGLLGLL